MCVATTALLEFILLCASIILRVPTTALYLHLQIYLRTEDALLYLQLFSDFMTWRLACYEEKLMKCNQKFCLTD